MYLAPLTRVPHVLADISAFDLTTEAAAIAAARIATVTRFIASKHTIAAHRLPMVDVITPLTHRRLHG